MAEILGVVGLVSGLVAISDAGAKISRALFNLGKSLAKAKSQITELAQELSSISTAFASLADVLENSGNLLKPSLLENTQAILADCQRTYIEIEDNVDLVQSSAMRARDRAQWVFRKAKVKQLRTRLESAKATLHLMVSILELSAGLKFLQQQHRLPENTIEEPRGHVKEKLQESAESVVNMQLAFDKAQECEKRLAERDSHRSYKALNDSSAIQPADSSMALIKFRPVHDFLADLPVLQEMTTTGSQHDHDDEIDGDEKHETSQLISRYHRLESQALAVVRQLCIRWTWVDGANDQGLLGDLPHGMGGEYETEQTAKHVDSRQSVDEQMVHRARKEADDGSQQNPGGKEFPTRTKDHKRKPVPGAFKQLEDDKGAQKEHKSKSIIEEYKQKQAERGLSEGVLKEQADREFEKTAKEFFLAAGYSEKEVTAVLKGERRDHFIRVHRWHIMPETLDAFHLPWVWDNQDPNFIFIHRWIGGGLQEELFEHTRRLLEEAAKMQRGAAPTEPRIAKSQIPIREREHPGTSFAPLGGPAVHPAEIDDTIGPDGAREKEKAFGAAGYSGSHIDAVLTGKRPEKKIWQRAYRRHIMPETLDYFKLPWHWDERDPDYVIIPLHLSVDFLEELFEHTRLLREEGGGVEKLPVNNSYRGKPYPVLRVQNESFAY